MSGFLHDDGLCARNSVDADGFAEAARQFARLADAIGLPDTGQSFAEIVNAALGYTADDSAITEIARRLCAAHQQQVETRIPCAACNQDAVALAVQVGAMAVIPIVRAEKEQRERALSAEAERDMWRQISIETSDLAEARGKALKQAFAQLDRGGNIDRTLFPVDYDPEVPPPVGAEECPADCDGQHVPCMRGDQADSEAQR